MHFALFALSLQRKVHISTAKLIKMAETLLLSVLIIAIAIALMSVKVIFLKYGKFKSMHIHDNKAMQERGIYCAIDQDRKARKDNKAF